MYRSMQLPLLQRTVLQRMQEWIWYYVRTLFKLFFSLICMILTISEFFRKGLVCIWFAYSEYDSWLHLHCRCTIFDGRYGVFLWFRFIFSWEFWKSEMVYWMNYDLVCLYHTKLCFSTYDSNTNMHVLNVIINHVFEVYDKLEELSPSD